jgi:Ca2+-binding EF-hand superfamily protein
MNSNGNINVRELTDYLQSTAPMYVQRLFAAFDENYDKNINFREFLVGCWNYCTVMELSLPIFCFDLYDHDCSGEVELKEILIMVSEIYGKGFETNDGVKRMLNTLTAEAKKNDDSDFATAADIRLRVADFIDFCKRHPLLLQPAYSVQSELRARICGLKFWKKCTKRRVASVNNTSTDAAEIIRSQARSQATHDMLSKNTGAQQPIKSTNTLLANVGSIASRRTSKQIEPQTVFKTPKSVGRFLQRMQLNSPVAELSRKLGPSKRKRKNPRSPKIHLS